MTNWWIRDIASSSGWQMAMRRTLGADSSRISSVTSGRDIQTKFITILQFLEHMTVSITACKVIALGNGAQTTFSYDFEMPIGSAYTLIYTDASGNQTTLSPSAYTVTGMGNANGGTFTYPLSGSPIAAGTSLTFIRQTPYTQATSLGNPGQLLPRC